MPASSIHHHGHQQYHLYCLECHVYVPGDRAGAEAFLIGAHTNHRYTVLLNAAASAARDQHGTAALPHASSTEGEEQQWALPIATLRADVDAYHTCVDATLRALDGHALRAADRSRAIAAQMGALEEELRRMRCGEGITLEEAAAIGHMVALHAVGQRLHGNVKAVAEGRATGGKGPFDALRGGGSQNNTCNNYDSSARGKGRKSCGGGDDASSAAAARALRLERAAAIDAEMDAIAASLKQGIGRLRSGGVGVGGGGIGSTSSRPNPRRCNKDGNSLLHSGVTADAHARLYLSSMLMGHHNDGNTDAKAKPQGGKSASEGRSPSSSTSYCVNNGLVNSCVVGGGGLSFSTSEEEPRRSSKKGGKGTEHRRRRSHSSSSSSSSDGSSSRSSSAAAGSSLSASSSSTDAKGTPLRRCHRCPPFSSSSEQQQQLLLPDVTLRAQAEAHIASLEAHLLGNHSSSAHAHTTHPSGCPHATLRALRRVIKAAQSCGDEGLAKEVMKHCIVRQAIKRYA